MIDRDWETLRKAKDGNSEKEVNMEYSHTLEPSNWTIEDVKNDGR